MIRVVKTTKKPESPSTDQLSRSQLKTIAQKMTKVIGIAVAEEPAKIRALLRKYRIRLSDQPNSKELIARLVDKLAHNDERFNMELGQLIHDNVPGIDQLEPFDNFEGAEAVASIGGGAASGAAGGGLWGAGLGIVSGILDLGNKSKEQKIEKDKASAMTFSSMLAYKTAKLQSKGGQKISGTHIAIGVTVVVVLLGLSYLVFKNKKETAAWNDTNLAT